VAFSLNSLIDVLSKHFLLQISHNTMKKSLTESNVRSKVSDDRRLGLQV
jgi:hypothetical protein